MPRGNLHSENNGYVIWIETRTKKQSALTGKQEISSSMFKTPVRDVYEATVLVADEISHYQSQYRTKVMQDWMKSIPKDGSLANATHTQTDRTTEIRTEFLYEEFTPEKRDEYERVVGIQADYDDDDEDDD